MTISSTRPCRSTTSRAPVTAARGRNRKWCCCSAFSDRGEVRYRPARDRQPARSRTSPVSSRGGRRRTTNVWRTVDRQRDGPIVPMASAAAAAAASGANCGTRVDDCRRSCRDFSRRARRPMARTGGGPPPVGEGLDASLSTRSTPMTNGRTVADILPRAEHAARRKCCPPHTNCRRTRMGDRHVAPPPKSALLRSEEISSAARPGDGRIMSGNAPRSRSPRSRLTCGQRAKAKRDQCWLTTCAAMRAPLHISEETRP